MSFRRLRHFLASIALFLTGASHADSTQKPGPESSARNTLVEELVQSGVLSRENAVVYVSNLADDAKVNELLEVLKSTDLTQSMLSEITK